MIHKLFAFSSSIITERRNKPKAEKKRLTQLLFRYTEYIKTILHSKQILKNKKIKFSTDYMHEINLGL